MDDRLRDTVEGGRSRRGAGFFGCAPAADPLRAAARRGTGGAEICPAKTRRDRLKRATQAGVEHYRDRKIRSGLSAVTGSAGRQTREPAAAIQRGRLIA